DSEACRRHRATARIMTPTTMPKVRVTRSGSTTLPDARQSDSAASASSLALGPSSPVRGRKSYGRLNMASTYHQLRRPGLLLPTRSTYLQNTSSPKGRFVVSVTNMESGARPVCPARRSPCGLSPVFAATNRRLLIRLNRGQRRDADALRYVERGSHGSDDGV